MAKPQQQQPSPHPPWGTLEELLLACAVNRHGTNSWDSIAMEVSNRTSTLSSLTSQNCIDKFNDLKRRFGFTARQNDTASSLVDELRKLRVDELRREVHQRDASIVSLEMKVKRLEEDRERSLKEKEKSSDLAKHSPEMVAGKSAGGEESGDGGERSFNESNSTSQQPQKAEVETEKEQNENTDIKPEPDAIKEDPDPDPARLGSDPEPEREWSHNGKLEDDDDKKPKKEMKIERLSRVGGIGPDSNELGESVGESKREEKEKDIKQINNNNNNNNSDVQSSVSLSLKKKKRRRSSGEGSSSGEEEREGGDDEVSPARKKDTAVKSEPWLKLLEIIRSHRLSSVFEKRLRSQESERYRKLIRQHMDLQMIQSRLNIGVYSNCFQKFFKDLLILLNNAVVFFRKNSPENLAANELRAVVLKEMKEELRKPKPQPVALKPATEQHSASLSKPNKSSTLAACSKHSSIKSISEGSGKKGDKRDREIEERPKVNEKKVEVSVVRTEEKGLKKKTTKERLISGRRNSKTSHKNGEIKHQYGGNELSSHDALEIKVDRKENTGRKKQGAASFLKRMKQNSPSRLTENGDDDSSEDESKDSKMEDKKRRGRESDGITKRVTRSSKGRGLGEDSRNIKRGRPPKKQMESGGGTGKRGRENDDSEVGVGGAGRSKKRSRR